MEHSCTSEDGYNFHCYEFNGQLWLVASAIDEDPYIIVQYCPFCGYHLEPKE